LAAGACAKTVAAYSASTGIASTGIASTGIVENRRRILTPFAKGSCYSVAMMLPNTGRTCK
jgi:hypothetical protein